MLPKKNRLSREEIEELKSEKKGRIIQGQYFGLIFQPQAGVKKFGLIISNNISKKATVRNKIKRLVYRAVRVHLWEKEGRFLFLAKKTSLGKGRGDLEKEIEDFKKKITR